MKTRSCKNKGARLQKWVCEQIAKTLGISFDNQDENCEIHSREMGLSGIDVILRGNAYRLFPFDTECKNTETISLYKNIEQAKANTKAGRSWLLIHKKNRSEPVAILDAETFFNIVGRDIKNDR